MSSINITRSVVKNYTLLDKDCNYYLQAWYDNGEFQKQLNLNSIHEDQKEYIRPHCLTIEQLISLKKIIKTIAPIDIRIFKDGQEIVEDNQKSNIINSLIIFEYKMESSSVLKPLTERAIKTAREESKVRSQLTNMVNSVARGIGGISVSKCKKIKSVLEEIKV